MNPATPRPAAPSNATRSNGTLPELVARSPTVAAWISLPPAALRLQLAALWIDLERCRSWPHATRRAFGFACRLLETWSSQRPPGCIVRSGAASDEAGERADIGVETGAETALRRLLSEVCLLALETGDVAAGQMMAHGLAALRLPNREGELLAGLVHFAAGRPQQAEASYREALDSGADPRVVSLLLGAVLRAQGRHGEARVVLADLSPAA